MNETEIRDAIGLRYALRDAAERYFGRQFRHEYQGSEKQEISIRDGGLIYYIEITTSLAKDPT